MSESYTAVRGLREAFWPSARIRKIEVSTVPMEEAPVRAAFRVGKQMEEHGTALQGLSVEPRFISVRASPGISPSICTSASGKAWPASAASDIVSPFSAALLTLYSPTPGVSAQPASEVTKSRERDRPVPRD